MSVRFTGRLALLLLIASLLASLRCAPAVQPLTVNCPPANVHRYQPQITVDETHLTATPKVAIVWDVEPDNPSGPPPFKPSNRPVKITWKTQNRFNLIVQFNDPSCGIQPPQCNGQGQCTAIVKPLAVRASVRCTYQMKNGDDLAKKDDEADIIIMPCCS
jgi:hypothetical protein